MACTDCQFKELNCKGKTAEHCIYPAVVHSSAGEMETMLEECDHIMRDFQLEEKRPDRVTSDTLITARGLKEKCEGASVHHSMFDPRLLVLQPDTNNEDAFKYLCQAGKC